MCVQPLATTLERHLFSCIRNGIYQRGCYSCGMFCGNGACFVIGSGLESVFICIASGKLFISKSRSDICSTPFKSNEKWIKSVWQTKWCSSERLKGFANGMFIFDEDVFLARRWSKHLITFRRLTLFYRQTMNRRAKYTYKYIQCNINQSIYLKWHANGSSALFIDLSNDGKKMVEIRRFFKTRLFHSCWTQREIFIKESNFTLHCIRTYQK